MALLFPASCSQQPCEEQCTERKFLVQGHCISSTAQYWKLDFPYPHPVTTLHLLNNPVKQMNSGRDIPPVCLWMREDLNPGFLGPSSALCAALCRWSLLAQLAIAV